MKLSGQMTFDPDCGGKLERVFASEAAHTAEDMSGSAAPPAASSGRRKRARGARATPYSTSARRKGAGSQTATSLPDL